MIFIKIAPEYRTVEELVKLVVETPFTFDDEGTILYDKRNTIRSIMIDNPNIPFRQIVVKRFKTPNLLQRISYSFFRSSKASRAFNNAIELRKRGINTPREIAYIEESQRKLIKSTYVITDYTDGLPIRDLLVTPQGINTEKAVEFARFAIELHSKGILHHDLNSTNVLYHSSEKGCCFSVIDINRMKFKTPSKLTIAECFENLTRFTGQMDLFEYVLQNYIRIRGWKYDLIEDAIKMKIRHDQQRVRRKAFLGKLKKLHHV